MERRAFVELMGAGVVAACTPRFPTARPATRLGVQLYTVRAAMAENVERTLARVASLGYREVEFAGYFDRTPANLKATLAAEGLTSPSAHIRSTLFGQGWDQELEAAAAMGHEQFILAWLAPEQRRTLDDYRRTAEVLNRAAEACRGAGMAFGYHNHDFEFARIDGQIPFDILVAETDPRLVRLQVDLYWMAKGLDPEAPFRYLTAQRERITSVHAKDIDTEGRMVDPGKGVLDLGRVLKASGGAIRHVFVEHDNPADPWETLRAGVATWGGLLPVS